MKSLIIFKILILFALHAQAEPDCRGDGRRCYEQEESQEQSEEPKDPKVKEYRFRSYHQLDEVQHSNAKLEETHTPDVD